jgi:predicted  nucleic acid-binding Zn-ribbon protein
MRQWENDLLERLLRVQEIDLKIRGVEMKISALYDQSMRDDPRLCKLKADAARLEESIETALSQQEMYLSTLEDIKSAIQGLVSTRAGAFKLRTRSSTEALKIEEDKLTVLVSETEDQIQKLREELVAVRESIVARSREVQAAQQAPEAEIRKLRNRARRLDKQREESVVGIPQLLLRKYERLRNSRSGIGLTIMRDGVCSVCRMQMPTGIRFRLFRGEVISACPACGRMVARIENPEANRLGLSILESGGGSDWDGDDDDSDEDGEVTGETGRFAAADETDADEGTDAGRAERPNAPSRTASKKALGKQPVGKKPAPKPEPRKPEPRKPEPRKPEPRKPQPRKPEPRKPEPRKPQPRKPEPRKPQPRKPQPRKPRPRKPEPRKPQPRKPEPRKPQPRKPRPSGKKSSRKR